MLNKIVEASYRLGPPIIAERNGWACFMHFVVDKLPAGLVDLI